MTTNIRAAARTILVKRIELTRNSNGEAVAAVGTVVSVGYDYGARYSGMDRVEADPSHEAVKRGDLVYFCHLAGAPVIIFDDEFRSLCEGDLLAWVPQ